MADISLEQLDKLFDKKLSPIRKELKGVNTRLDLVAGHVVKIDRRLDTVEEALKTVLDTQQRHTQQLATIERLQSHDTDRLDDHGTRIETLEAKTAHLPSQPRSR